MVDLVVRAEWRKLIVRRWGDPSGTPVFLLHGTPGSRLGHRPAEAFLRALGVDLITYDRPGYGGSDPVPGRRVVDAAEDVERVANALRLDSFAVLGRSGGGPHALACAALLPERVTRVACMVGLAPFDAPGLDWMGGMAELNRHHYSAAHRGRRQLAQVMYPQVVAMRDDPEHLVNQLEAFAGPDDLAVLRDPGYRGEFVSNIREAVGGSLAGWADDSLAFTRPWGFDPGWIRIPTLIWHATWDRFSPLPHGQWLAERIAGSRLVLCERSGHLAAAEAQHRALHWLIGDEGALDRAVA